MNGSSKLVLLSEVVAALALAWATPMIPSPLREVALAMALCVVTVVVSSVRKAGHPPFLPLLLTWFGAAAIGLGAGRAVGLATWYQETAASMGAGLLVLSPFSGSWPRWRAIRSLEAWLYLPFLPTPGSLVATAYMAGSGAVALLPFLIWSQPAAPVQLLFSAIGFFMMVRGWYRLPGLYEIYGDLAKAFQEPPDVEKGGPSQ